jgi:putative flavoprotein involved in K+ transport
MATGMEAQVRRWIADFEAAVGAGDATAAARLFMADGLWRDILAFTWNLVTLEGRGAIERMLGANLKRLAPIRLSYGGAAEPGEEGPEAYIRIETALGSGRGHLRLRRGKARTLLTTLETLSGHAERTGPSRPMGISHVAAQGRATWLEERAARQAALGRSEQPYCVIVGGGQGGIALGARLKQLGVPTIVAEANPKPGDTWRNRYKSLVLHDPVWYDHLPYVPFPDHWPVFTPKDQLGDWLEAYVSIMDLDYWGSTRCERADFDAGSKTWTLTFDRAGETVELRPKQFVLATGSYGKPRIPDLPGRESFDGPILHSADYRSGADFAGRRCAVLGSNSSAHDICADLWENGAKAVMIQRSPTTVIRSEAMMEHAFKGLYSEEALARGITTDTADLLFASMPLRLQAEAQRKIYARIRAEDADFYRALEAAGFLIDWGEDESGLMLKALRRGSGYYLDVGCSRLIIEGAVKVLSGAGVERLSPGAIHLEDGRVVKAEALILATGYGSMTTRLADMVPAEMAEKVGSNWGYGSGFRDDPGPWLGELRNMWKPLAQEALWYHGGNLHLSRFYSKFLALQIKARMEGISTPVWAG